MVDSHVRLEKKRIVNVYLSPLMKMIQVVDSIIAKILSPSIFRETTFGLVFYKLYAIYIQVLWHEKGIRWKLIYFKNMHSIISLFGSFLFGS
jgi:hypothetical protein